MYQGNVGVVNANGPGGTASGVGGGARTPAETCASLFPRTRKLRVDIEVMLERFEKNNGGPDEVMMRKLTSDLSRFFANIEHMQDVLSQEYNQRDMWEMRIANMRDSYRSLRRTYDREMAQWDRRIRDSNNRRELFNMRGTSAESKSIAKGLSDEGSLLRETLASGTHTAEWLGSISEHIGAQGDRLKGVQRSLLTMASTLGLSDSVIKMISRREFMDRMLVLFLMILTLIVFFLCYRYL